MGSPTKTIAAMVTDKNSNGFNFGTTTNVGGSFGNRFEGQRFAGATTGVVAAFQKQVPDFLRTDPDVVRMVAALNREENISTGSARRWRSRGRTIIDLKDGHFWQK